MATIKKFEDLDIWNEAREINKRIFEIASRGDLRKDYRLYGQIDGASGSIMDNIAEGFERNGNKEFVQFLSIAKASCGEVRSQLYRLYDRNYVSQEEFDNLKFSLESLSKRIAGFINYLRKSDLKGSKFKTNNLES